MTFDIAVAEHHSLTEVSVTPEHRKNIKTPAELIPVDFPMSGHQYQMLPEYDSLEGLCQDETKVYNMFRYYSDEDTRYGRYDKDFPHKYPVEDP